MVDQTRQELGRACLSTGISHCALPPFPPSPLLSPLPAVTPTLPVLFNFCALLPCFSLCPKCPSRSLYLPRSKCSLIFEVYLEILTSRKPRITPVEIASPSGCPQSLSLPCLSQAVIGCVPTWTLSGSLVSIT